MATGQACLQTLQDILWLDSSNHSNAYLQLMSFVPVKLVCLGTGP